MQDALTRDIPKGAQYYLDGIYYKIGVHGFVFFYLGKSWIKSSNTQSDLERIIKQLKVKQIRDVELRDMRVVYNHRYKNKLEARKEK